MPTTEQKANRDKLIAAAKAAIEKGRVNTPVVPTSDAPPVTVASEALVAATATTETAPPASLAPVGFPVTTGAHGSAFGLRRFPVNFFTLFDYRILATPTELYQRYIWNQLCSYLAASRSNSTAPMITHSNTTPDSRKPRQSFTRARRGRALIANPVSATNDIANYIQTNGALINENRKNLETISSLLSILANREFVEELNPRVTAAFIKIETALRNENSLTTKELNEIADLFKELNMKIQTVIDAYRARATADRRKIAFKIIGTGFLVVGICAAGIYFAGPTAVTFIAAHTPAAKAAIINFMYLAGAKAQLAGVTCLDLLSNLAQYMATLVATHPVKTAVAGAVVTVALFAFNKRGGGSAATNVHAPEAPELAL